MGDDPPYLTFRDVDGPTYTKLEVYQQALDFVGMLDAIFDGATGARFAVKDTLDRASTMIALHIAQATGEASPTLRRRQYGIARRRATDCAAMLDILARKKTIDPNLLQPAQQLCLALAAQLGALAAR